MQTETINTTVLIADEGKILTDGKVYGRTIYLAKTAPPRNFTKSRKRNTKKFRNRMMKEGFYEFQ